MRNLLLIFIVSAVSACSVLDPDVPTINQNNQDGLLTEDIELFLPDATLEEAQDGVKPVEADFTINNAGNEVDENMFLELTNLSQNASSWHWDFGNGQTSTERNPKFSYPIHGIYPITLTVKDKWGNSHSTTKEILVLCVFGGGGHEE